MSQEGRAQDGMASQARVDPELLRQLNKDASDAHPVEAVVFLRVENGKRKPAGASKKVSRGTKSAGSNGATALGSTETRVKDLLRRAEMHSGSHPKDFNIFGNMGSFVVIAEPAFLKALMKEPEVESMVANRQRAPIEVLRDDRKS